MIKKVRYGFQVNGIEYGWIDKKLFRLPCISKRGFLPLKELSLIHIGNNIGYRVGTKKKTIKQLQSMTEVINYTLELNGTGKKDCPF